MDTGGLNFSSIMSSLLFLQHKFHLNTDALFFASGGQIATIREKHLDPGNTGEEGDKCPLTWCSDEICHRYVRSVNLLKLFLSFSFF